jgi:hypothetical protein
MLEGPVALIRSLSGELGRLGQSSGSWEEASETLRRVASQLHAGLDHRPR